MGRMLLGFLLILSVFGTVTASISDLRLCGDPECKEPVSKGVTVLAYHSNDKDVISFPNNAPVLVYSKEAGSRQDLWGVEIKGKRGYAPLRYIREHKILKSKLEYEVPTEAGVGKGDGGHGNHNLSKESVSEGTKAEEEAVSDLAKSLNVAITAEDVEYNSLPPAAPTEGQVEGEEATSHTSPPDQSAEPEQDGSQSSSSSSSESSTTESDVAQEEKEVVKEEEEEDEGYEEAEEEVEEVEEEEEEAKDIQEVEKTHEIKESDNTENEVINNDKASEAPEAPATESPPEDFEKEEQDATNEEVLVPSGSLHNEPSAPPLEPTPEPPLPSSPSEEKENADLQDPENLVNLEPSSVAFEVIDGTTLYLDEDISTATTTPRDPQASELPSASPVLGDVPATLPIPALLHHTPPTNPPGDAAKDSKLTNPEVDPSQAADPVPSPDPEKLATDEEKTALDDMELPAPATDDETATESSINVSEKENTSLAEETEVQADDGDEEIHEEIYIDGHDTPVTEDKEPEVASTPEETQNEFGAPKEETIIETHDIPTEKPVESEGFFASWFGSSSETMDPPETEETPETHDPSKSEAPQDDTVDPEATSSEDMKDVDDGGGGEATHSVTDLPPDDIAIPVDKSEGANTVRVPNGTEDVDENAPNSSQSNLSSVESSSSPTPDMEQSPDVLPPTSDNASSADLGDIANDTAEGSEEDAGHYLGGEEEEPGPSTARPMYAEPEPTTQSYTDPNVDADDLARLAEPGESVAGDTQQSSVEESLTEKFLKASHNLLPEGLAFGVEAEVAEPEMSQGALVFLGVVVVTIITIYVVHLVMLKLSRESPILEALNTMDREKRLLLHENTTLHDELCKARSELDAVKYQITESSGDISDLDTQLELIKSEHAAETAQHEEKIAQLEHELEEATNNSIEMHKMLSEMLSAQKDTSTFQASVDHLQEMLDGQQEKVEALNSDLALKTRLNEELHLELSSAREQVTKLDSQVQQLTQSLKELSSSKEDTSQHLMKEIELVKELQDVNESLSKQSVDHDQQLTDLSQELQTLHDTIATLRESVETKDSELKVAKECLKKIQLSSDDAKAAPDDEKLSSLFDVITIKAELQRTSNERLNLEEQLRDSEMAQKNLEDAMSSIRSEVTELRVMHDEAIQEKQEAISKLAVLTQYFEEKEAQLTKELESQEGLRMNAEGTAASVGHKIRNYELEVASYKAQVESLRKELQDQEKSYKTQLDSVEKKAHDNWLQARAAERKHEEQRQENSQLRNRLTMLQKEREDIQGGILKPTPKRLDANGRMPSPIEGDVDGEHSESPPHPLHGPPSVLPMMLPHGAPLPPGIPPPHGFPGVPPPPPPPGLPRGVPPPFHPGEFPFMRPPLPPLPGDRRLPPAGGMSSPPYRRSGSPSYSHRNDRYSPSSEHSHLSDRHYSPPPLRHRPPSPDMHRRNHSPDRRSDRLRSPDRRSDRVRASPDHHRSNRRTPDRRLDRRSPDRHFSTRSPDGYHRHRSSPHDYYDHSDYNSDDSRLHQTPHTGKKTSTPLAPSDRWKNDV